MTSPGDTDGTPPAAAEVPSVSRPAPPAVVELRPQRGPGRVVSVLLLASVPAAGLTGYVAWQDRTTASTGVAATFAALTLVLWAVRASSAPARVVVDHGVLDIRARGGHHRFDLTSRYAVLEVVGSPGSRGWQVRFHRRGLAPYVVDRSMVDPEELMAVVRRYRPDLTEPGRPAAADR